MRNKGLTLCEILNDEALVVLGTLPGEAGNVWYNHKDRSSICNKLWLTPQNDIFFFSTKVNSGWNMVHALLVKESVFNNKVWIEGRDVKFLKRDSTFQYTGPQGEPDDRWQMVDGRWRFITPVKVTTACRICRLPWDFGPERKERLVPVVVYVSADAPEHVFTMNGHISAIEGTGKDVKAVLHKGPREGASNMALLSGHAFWLIHGTGMPRADMMTVAGSNTQEDDEPSMAETL